MGQPGSKRLVTTVGPPSAQAAPFENYQPPGGPPPLQGGYVLGPPDGPVGNPFGPRLARYPASSDQSVLVTDSIVDYPPPNLQRRMQRQQQLPRRSDFPQGPAMMGDNFPGMGDDFWMNEDDNQVVVPAAGPNSRGRQQFYADDGMRQYDPFNDGPGPRGGGGPLPRQGFMQNFEQDMRRQMGQERMQMQRQQQQQQMQMQQQQMQQQQGFQSPQGPAQPRVRKITSYVNEPAGFRPQTGGQSVQQGQPQVIQSLPQGYATQPQMQAGGTQPTVIFYDPATGALTGQQQQQQQQAAGGVQFAAPSFPQVAATSQTAQQQQLPPNIQQMLAGYTGQNFPWGNFPFAQQQQQQAAQPIVIPGSMYTPNGGMQSFGGYQPQAQ